MYQVLYGTAGVIMYVDNELPVPYSRNIYSNTLSNLSARTSRHRPLQNPCRPPSIFPLCLLQLAASIDLTKETVGRVLPRNLVVII